MLYSLLFKLSLFLQYPRASEEHLPVSSRHGAVSVLSTGLLVDTNLDTSVPDAYRPPPPPMPFDMVLGHAETPRGAQATSNDKDDGAVQTTNSDSVQATTGINTREISAKCEDKELDCKAQIDLELDSAKELELDLPKSIEPLISGTEEEDVCPTCLEGNYITIFFRLLVVMHITSNKVILPAIFFSFFFHTNNGIKFEFFYLLCRVRCRESKNYHKM